MKSKVFVRFVAASSNLISGFFFFKHTDSSLVMPFYGETMFLDGRGLSTVPVVVVEDKMAISPVRIIKKCREHFSNVQRHAESKVTMNN